VRRFVGYDRYASKAAFATLAQLYELLRLYLNYFQPVRKVVRKERVGAKLRKTYDQAATPYQRLLSSGVLTDAQRARLARLYPVLNPVDLRTQIEAVLHRLAQTKELPQTARRLTRPGRAEALGLTAPRSR
jgi:hypothetical protein